MAGGSGRLADAELLGSVFLRVAADRFHKTTGLA